MKTIALVDPHIGGHHITYLRLFSKVFLELNCQLIVFCQNPNDLRNWVSIYCPQYSDRLICSEIQEPNPQKFFHIKRSTLLTVIENWRNVANSIKKVRLQTGVSPDLVFFSWLDTYLRSSYLIPQLLDIIFPYRWSGLYLLPNYLRLGNDDRQKRFFQLSPESLLKSHFCLSVGLLDEGVVGTLKTRIKKPVVTFPDCTDESPPNIFCPILQEIKKKAENRKIIGLLGGLTKRKGILKLLEVPKSCLDKNIFFVFAGQLNTDTFSSEELSYLNHTLQSPPKNCFFYFHRIPDEQEFNALVNECDILFAVYENFKHSSNILTKAALFKKPVIVSNQFCMGERVKKFRLGLTVEAGNIQEYIEAINYLTKTENLKILKPDFETYSQLHSVKSLKSSVEHILRYV